MEIASSGGLIHFNKILDHDIKYPEASKHIMYILISTSDFNGNKFSIDNMRRDSSIYIIGGVENIT